MGMIAIGLGLYHGWVGRRRSRERREPVVVALFCLGSCGVSVIVGGLANRALQTSPGSTDLAIATQGSLYNTGYALGSLSVPACSPRTAPQSLPVVSVGFVTIALVLVALERRFGGPVSR